MSKQDQAARIAAKEIATNIAKSVWWNDQCRDQEKWTKKLEDRICKAIMRNGDKRAQEERERCVECVAYSKRATQIVHHAGMCDAIIDAIRKGKA